MRLDRICTFAAGVLLSMSIGSAQELVIRIDDLGSSHSANKACIDTYVNGIAQSVEVMPVAAWFPEAVRMLRENPGLDVGVHLTVTSEWENVKWRPLTHCPSLVDGQGYFWSKIWRHQDFPGQTLKDHKWDIREVEQEFRAQIEMCLRYIPQTSHISGHMGSNGFSPEIVELIDRLSEEYDLPSIDSPRSYERFQYGPVKYFDKPKGDTVEERVDNLKRAFEPLEPGCRYLFLDHPAYDDVEMQGYGHIGYYDVAQDRQLVTDELCSTELRDYIAGRGMKLITINQLCKGLPRGNADAAQQQAFERYLDAVQASGQDLHSVMVLQHGNVIFEKWLGSGSEMTPHVLNSVSKTFTSMAVGLAVSEGLLSVEDKVISFFPDKLPEQVSDNLAAMRVRDLLTMTCGHASDPTRSITAEKESDWVSLFLSKEVAYEPGTYFCYNTIGTYMLSAIVQKVTGEKIVDYLNPRLFRPLGIVNVRWDESPQGINLGGFGLFLKTEDLAKLGQLLLQKGQWKGRQLLPASWVEAASACQVASVPSGVKPSEARKRGLTRRRSDWVQGYGYQMWRCRHEAFRADGARGQYIIVVPDRDAVIVTTADVNDMQSELNLIWDYIYPAL